MKNLILFLAIVSAIAVQGCKKSSSPANTTVYTGVVIVSICGSIAVQTLGPAYLGETNWVNGNNPDKPVLNHVFRVQNSCQFLSSGVRGTFNFRVIPAVQTVQNCVLCNAIGAVPQTAYSIEVIK